jgi:hypothetical protein
MQTRSIAVHPVEMLVYVGGFFKATAAIGTAILKAPTDKALVILTINPNSPTLRNRPA